MLMLFKLNEWKSNRSLEMYNNKWLSGYRLALKCQMIQSVSNHFLPFSFPYFEKFQKKKNVSNIW